MTLAGRIAWDDTVLPFQLDRADIRGRVGAARLGARDDPRPARLSGAGGGAGRRGGADHRADRPDDQAALAAQPADPRRRAGAADRHRLLRADRGGRSRRGCAPMPATTPQAVAAADGAAPFDLLGQGVFAHPDRPGAGDDALPGDDADRRRARSPTAPRPTSPSPSSCRPASRWRWARRSSRAAAAHWRGGGVLLQHMPKASPYADGGATRLRRAAGRRRTCSTAPTRTTGAGR